MAEAKQVTQAKKYTNRDELIYARGERIEEEAKKIADMIWLCFESSIQSRVISFYCDVDKNNNDFKIVMLAKARKSVFTYIREFFVGEREQVSKENQMSKVAKEFNNFDIDFLEQMTLISKIENILVTERDLYVTWEEKTLRICT